MRTGTSGFLAEAAQDFEAIDAREHDVEHHQIDAGLEGPVEAAVAFMGCLHGKAFAAEELAEEGGEFGVVIDQQDVHGSNLPRGRAGGEGGGCPVGCFFVTVFHPFLGGKPLFLKGDI